MMCEDFCAALVGMLAWLEGAAGRPQGIDAIRCFWQLFPFLKSMAIQRNVVVPEACKFLMATKEHRVADCLDRGRSLLGTACTNVDQ